MMIINTRLIGVTARKNAANCCGVSERAGLEEGRQ
jgi:hypothetical protein